jgi:putative SOS response-associated peptidase YedK
MCGRYTLTRPELLPDEFEITDLRLPPRFNVAPTQSAPIVRMDAQSGREPALLRWGLVPHWSRETAPNPRTINARAETLTEKPSFRDAFRKRRCLVPADGFFEWTAADRLSELHSWAAGERDEAPAFPPAKNRSPKVPWYIRMRDSRPFAFAGLWEVNRRGDTPLETFTIITCEPNSYLRPFHDRMPAILDPVHFSRWLDPATPLEVCQALLVPYPASEIAAYAVGQAVSRVSVDDPSCILPRDSMTGSLFEGGEG